MSISTTRLHEVISYNVEHGDQATIEEYQITHETLNRYKRELRRENPPKKLPNILIFDIETAPMEVFVWGLYLQRINHDNVIQDWFVLSWSAKWLFSKEVMSDVLTPKEAKKGDDKRICDSMWKLFESADIIIAHNAKRFDIRKMNSRWILHRMSPPSPYLVIDTLMESRKMAAHSSHRLDYLGLILRNKQKLETDYSLWKRCKAGKKKALKYMVKYNRKDTVLLEEVYLDIRPWIKGHPNIGLYMDTTDPVCSYCGSTELHPVDDYNTKVGAYSAYRCKCGGISHERFSKIPLKKKKRLLKAV